MKAFQLVISFCGAFSRVGVGMHADTLDLEQEKILEQLSSSGRTVGRHGPSGTTSSHPSSRGDYRGGRCRRIHAMKNRSTEVSYLVFTSSVNSRFSHNLLIQDNFLTLKRSGAVDQRDGEHDPRFGNAVPGLGKERTMPAHGNYSMTPPCLYCLRPEGIPQSDPRSAHGFGEQAL